MWRFSVGSGCHPKSLFGQRLFMRDDYCTKSLSPDVILEQSLFSLCAHSCLEMTDTDHAT